MRKIKIGTFNVNNLFERPKVLELEGFNATGKAVLKDVADLEALLENTSYAGNIGDKIVEILNKYYHDIPSNPWFTINQIREKLFSIKQDGSGVALKARGRGSWLGWVELTKQTTNEISIQNTARVVKAIDADILCVVEVDDRIALRRFNEFLLSKEKVKYPHVMVIDGNDERGIMSAFCRVTRLIPSKHILTTLIIPQMGKPMKFSAVIALNIKLTLAADSLFTIFVII